MEDGVLSGICLGTVILQRFNWSLLAPEDVSVLHTLGVMLKGRTVCSLVPYLDCSCKKSW